MKKLILITLSLLMLAGLATAHGRYEPIKTAEFAAHPETFDGRLVEIRADIVAFNADGKSLEVFDSESRVAITVKLSQIQKSQRSALIHSPARRLLVYGQAIIVGPRLVIDAHKIAVLPSDARVQ